MSKEQYLGDSVYARYEGNGVIVLYLESGYGPRNELVLEPEVKDALDNFYNRCIEEEE